MIRPFKAPLLRYQLTPSSTWPTKPKTGDINSEEKVFPNHPEFGTIMSSRRPPMSELVRTSGHESRDLPNLVFNHSTMNPVRNGYDR